MDCGGKAERDTAFKSTEVETCEIGMAGLPSGMEWPKASAVLFALFLALPLVTLRGADQAMTAEDYFDSAWYFNAVRRLCRLRSVSVLLQTHTHARTHSHTLSG